MPPHLLPEVHWLCWCSKHSWNKSVLSSNVRVHWMQLIHSPENRKTSSVAYTLQLLINKTDSLLKMWVCLPSLLRAEEWVGFPTAQCARGTPVRTFAGQKSQWIVFHPRQGFMHSRPWILPLLLRVWDLRHVLLLRLKQDCHLRLTWEPVQHWAVEGRGNLEGVLMITDYLAETCRMT